MGTELAQSTSVIREKVEFLTELFTTAPEAARVDVPSATAILESGLAFRTVHPDGSSITTDMPIALGGAEAAPSPGWLLSAAIASCVGTTIAMRSAQLGIGLTTLEVSVDAGADARGLLGVGDDVRTSMSGFKVVVRFEAAGGSADEVRQIIGWAYAHSPVLSTLREALTVDVEIQAA